ncbi:hypothetical protein ACFE04_019727 [Oxalis oulophora]
MKARSFKKPASTSLERLRDDFIPREDYFTTDKTIQTAFWTRRLILELHYTGETHVLPRTHSMRLSVTFALGTASDSSPRTLTSISEAGPSPLRLVEWHFAPRLWASPFPPSGPHMAHLLLAEWLSRLTFSMELLCS